MTEHPKSLLDAYGQIAGKIALGLVVMTMIILVGKDIIDMENRVISEITLYCQFNPDVEMWDSPYGMTNCTAWRDGKVVAT